jgi:hypothetical protein
MDFKALSGESTPNLVNRLDPLHMQIGGPQLQAVTKLLDALRKDMRVEVQQKLSARYAHTDERTVRRAGEIAEEIERNAAELSLYTAKATSFAGSNNNAPGKSGNVVAPRSDQKTCHKYGKVGHIQRDCREGGSVVNARYADASAKQKADNLSNVVCDTCGERGHYSNKCSQRQPRSAMGTREKGKPWCSTHQLNTHSDSECWSQHAHLKEQAGGQEGPTCRCKKRSVQGRRFRGAEFRKDARNVCRVHAHTKPGRVRTA